MKDKNTKITSVLKILARTFTIVFSAFIILLGIYLDIFFMLSYGSPKFNFPWTTIFVPLTFYAVNFLLLFFSAKKLGYTKSNANVILAIHIFLRLALSICAVCLFSLVLKYIIFLLLMSIPCLSGAVTTKVIQNRKDN